MDESAFIRDLIKCLVQETGPDIREQTELFMNKHEILDTRLFIIKGIIDKHKESLSLFGIRGAATDNKLFLTREKSVICFQETPLGDGSTLLTMKGYLKG